MAKTTELKVDYKALPKHLTPPAAARWPKVSKPDTKFKEEGEYSIQLRFSGEVAQGLIEFYDGHYSEFLADAQEQLSKPELKEHGSRPYKPAVDDNDEEIPGVYDFTFKSSAARKDRESGKFIPMRMPVFDTAGKPVNEEVWGGSVCRVAFRLKPWYTGGLGFGVKAELQAVQVHELVTAGGQSADAYGFNTSGDGFVSNGESASDEAPSNVAEEDDDDF